MRPESFPPPPPVEGKDDEAPWQNENAPRDPGKHDVEDTVRESLKVITPTYCLIHDVAEVEDRKRDQQQTAKGHWLRIGRC